LLVTKDIFSPNPNKIMEDYQYIRSQVNKTDEELPHIVVYDEIVKEIDLPKIYNASDAFVLISRGEGQGLPYMEAGSCGLPVIGSFCTGQSSLLNEENSYLVYPEGFEKANVNGYLSTLAKHCRFYENQYFPIFNEDSISKTSQLMREIFENQEKAKEKGTKLQETIHSQYSWDNCVNNIYNRIIEIGA
jgi:glycosyltransferase involved in cell wall biosynthesis